MTKPGGENDITNCNHCNRKYDFPLVNVSSIAPKDHEIKAYAGIICLLFE